jgi:hypothetical protein
VRVAGALCDVCLVGIRVAGYCSVHNGRASMAPRTDMAPGGRMARTTSEGARELTDGSDFPQTGDLGFSILY